MAGEMNPTEFDQENQLAMVVVDQPAKTDEPRFYEGTMFGLPREWIVELRPRKASSKYRGKVDQFFYEPGTRMQFRSLKAVKKQLNLDMGQPSHKGKPKASKVARQSENLHEKGEFTSKAARQSNNVDEKHKYGSSCKVAEEDKNEEHYGYFNKITKRVKWQLTNAEENCWNMYVKIPDAVQERWMNTFLRPSDNNHASNPEGIM